MKQKITTYGYHHVFISSFIYDKGKKALQIQMKNRKIGISKKEK